MQLFAKAPTSRSPQFLDDNQLLILAILENQKLGKLDVCSLCVVCGRSPFPNLSQPVVSLQTRLQSNLVYLASLADHQPPSGAPT